MPCPGFLTCRVFLLDEKGATVADDLAQAAFDPEKLRPMTDMPEDFAAFWERAKAENAKIPMDPRVERAEQWCTDKVDVYYVRLQSFRKDNYVYGYVSVPKSKGPHPAVLYVPGQAFRNQALDLHGREGGDHDDPRHPRHSARHAR